MDEMAGRLPVLAGTTVIRGRRESSRAARYPAPPASCLHLADRSCTTTGRPSDDLADRGSTDALVVTAECFRDGDEARESGEFLPGRRCDARHHLRDGAIDAIREFAAFARRPGVHQRRFDAGRGEDGVERGDVVRPGRAVTGDGRGRPIGFVEDPGSGAAPAAISSAHIDASEEAEASLLQLEVGDLLREARPNLALETALLELVRTLAAMLRALPAVEVAAEGSGAAAAVRGFLSDLAFHPVVRTCWLMQGRSTAT